MAIDRVGAYRYTYYWKNNAERARYHGKLCRILARSKMNSVLLEFECGHLMVTSRRSIRKIRDEENRETGGGCDG